MEELLAVANWFGSGLCHQWDSHSYSINGVPLCLCARCTGTYLGVLLTLVVLALRTRGRVQMPRAPYLFAFVIFFVMWAGDGVNSLLSSMRGAPFLYPPQNLFRLTTGMLMGIALGSLAFVILNSLLTSPALDKAVPPLFTRGREFVLLLALGAGTVALINTQWDWLLYPVTTMLLVAMVGVNSIIWFGFLSSLYANPTERTVMRRNLVLSLILTLVLLSGIALSRLMSGVTYEPPM